MQASFQDRAKETLANADRFLKNSGDMRVGLEVEYGLIGDDSGPVNETVRNFVVASQPEVLDAELGAAQIELRTDPINIAGDAGLDLLLAQLSQRESQMELFAHQCGAHVLSHGANPFVAISKIVRTDKVKYQMIPDYHNQHRLRPTVIGREPVDVGDAAVVSLFNAVQANIETSGFGDAVDKLNRSLMLSPLAVCIAANARLLDEKDTGFSDVRMIAWEISHDTRSEAERMADVPTRVGLPQDYYIDMPDYFAQVASFPFILDAPDHAFEIGIGLNWRDARIKFINESVVVEFRPVSTQSTPEQNVAAMAFYTGRLLWSQQQQELLLPMPLVRGNKMAAMTSGINAKLFAFDDNGTIQRVLARDLLPIEIERAKAGLLAAGIGNESGNNELLALLGENLAQGTLSDRLARHVLSSPLQRRTAIIKGLHEIRAIR